MELKPSPALKSRYYLEYGLAFVLGVFSWSIPVTFFIPSEYLLIWILSIHLPTFALLIYSFWWISRWYESVKFTIGDREVISRFGVFWKQERRVDLSKINMVHVSQGPIQRHFKTKHVHAHTAAMGGASTAEVTFFDLSDAEETKEKILELVEKRRSGAKPEEKERVEREKTSIERVVEELISIRKLLEKENK